MRNDPPAAVELPEPPYLAVIFSSQRRADHEDSYSVTVDRMEELARRQPGFLGVESVRDNDGRGITVSYWKDLESIQSWRKHSEHLVAQETGRTKWYESFRLKICRVERASSFHCSDN